MRARDLILTTTRLNPEDFEGAQGMRVRERVRDNLARAKKFGLNVILVLGATGDEILRTCPELEEADLAFDPNFEGEIFSSIQAGVLAATGAAFVLDAGEETLDDFAWIALDDALFSASADADVLQLSLGSTDRAQTPQLITLNGLKRLRKLPMQASWADRFLVGTPDTAPSADQIRVQVVEWSQNHTIATT